MLHAGLDLSRRRLDYCLLDQHGDRVETGAAPPDGGGLLAFSRGIEERHGPVLIRAAIESMNGARFVHDTLERCGWEVEVADAQKVKGAGAAGVQDRSYRRVGAGRAVANSAARRSLRSTSPAGSLKRSSTCSPATNPSLRQAPRPLWPHRRPFLRCATGARHPYNLVPTDRWGDRELRHARHHHPPRGP
jgi:hypothetical protein